MIVLNKVTKAKLDDYNSKTAVGEKIDEITFFNNFRVRLFPSSVIPIWKSYSNPATDVLVVDSIKSETESEDMNLSYEPENVPRDQEMDIDDGQEGGPLKFEFLTLASMKANGDFNFPMRYAGGSSQEFFNCNPIPSKDAFQLRDMVVASDHFEQQISGYPIVFITDGSDSMQTALMSLQMNKNRINTSITKFFGRVNKDIIRELVVLTNRFKSLEKRSKATAVYSIISAKPSGLTACAPVLAKMNLTFKWQEGIKDDTFLVPPSPSASALLHVSPGWKDVRVCLFENSIELEFILSLAKSLTDSVNMVFPKTDKKPEEVYKSINDLIDSSRGIQREAASQSNRFFDFTEHLWAIIKHCDSYETLVSALKIVFNALKELRINTIVHHDNKSTIARLVRDSLSGELLLPRLEALTPIQLLLEIGIERFRRDMVHMFVKEALATSEKEIADSKFLDTNPEQRACSLLPMHLALQTMLEIKKNLQINSHQIVNMTRVVLHQYCASPITDISAVSFETDVSFVDIKPEIMENVQPLTWTNETAYMHRVPIATTVTNFTRDNNYKHLEKYIYTKTKSAEEETDVMEQYVCSLSTFTTIHEDNVF